MWIKSRARRESHSSKQDRYDECKYEAKRQNIHSFHKGHDRASLGMTR